MDQQPDADRLMSPVASGPSWLRSAWGKKVGITAASLGAIGLLGGGVYGMMNEKGIPTKPADIGVSTISQQVSNPPEPIRRPVPEPAPVPVVAAPPPLAVPETAPPSSVRYVVFPTSGGLGSFNVLPPEHKEEASGSNAAAGGSAGAASADAVTKVAFKPAMLPGGKAGPAMRLTYLMMPQPIPCRLDQALESTLAGPLFCKLTGDVMSPEHVLLMKQGTLVTGSYRNEVKEGQHRVFAMSAVGYTPEGIPVPLEGEMADALGRNGIAGDYDAHILERFGAAGALTALQSAMSLAQSEMASKSGGNTYLNLNGGGGGGVQELATEILHNQIQIAPTISVPPGTIVNLMIDKPIDFGDALHVETRR